MNLTSINFLVPLYGFSYTRVTMFISQIWSCFMFHLISTFHHKLNISGSFHSPPPHPTHTHSHSHSQTHTHTNSLSLSYTHTLSHSLTHALTHALTQALTHTLTHTFTHPYTHKHTHTHTHTQTHTHHTYKHTHTHTDRQNQTITSPPLPITYSTHTLDLVSGFRGRWWNAVSQDWTWVDPPAGRFRYPLYHTPAVCVWPRPSVSTSSSGWGRWCSSSFCL